MLTRLLDEIRRLWGWRGAASDTEASFRTGWQQAMRGETHPIAELWDDLDGLRGDNPATEWDEPSGLGDIDSEWPEQD